MTPVLIMEGLFLLAAAVADKETGEVNARYTLCNALALLLYLLNEGSPEQIKQSMITFVFLFILLSAVGLHGELGGADIIICSSLSFCLGFTALWVVFISFALTLPFLIAKIYTKGYPFIPFIFVGYNIIILSI